MDALLQEGFALMAEMDVVEMNSEREAEICQRLDEIEAVLGPDWWDAE